MTTRARKADLLASINSNRVVRRVLLAAAAGIALSAIGMTPGCVGYNVYPPMEGEHGFTNVNSDPFPPIMTESLRWVVMRYPPNEHAEWQGPAAGNVGVTPFAVNLPQGVTRLLGERIVKNIGMGAVAMFPGNEKLPTYAISRVWVNGDEAKVDIVRPVSNVAFDSQGSPVTQGITVRLRGGMEQWHVTSHRLWSYNSMQPPATNYLPGSDFGQTPAPVQPPTAAPKTKAPPMQPQPESPSGDEMGEGSRPLGGVPE